MPRRTKPTPTERERRRQIIDLLAGHLAAMPGALAVPPESPKFLTTACGRSALDVLPGIKLCDGDAAAAGLLVIGWGAGVSRK